MFKRGEPKPTGYGAAAFVKDLRAPVVTPHIAQNDTNRAPGLMAHNAAPGLCGEQQKRKRIEVPFG